jgi:hypothetical protein
MISMQVLWVHIAPLLHLRVCVPLELEGRPRVCFVIEKRVLALEGRVSYSRSQTQASSAAYR